MAAAAVDRMTALWASYSTMKETGGIIRAGLTRMFLGTLALVLGSRWCYRHFHADPAPLMLDAFVHCLTSAPILVGTHHKTGTVLLQHVLKDACPILGWRCSFNDVPVACKSPEQAQEAGLHLCFSQHGVRFKLGGGGAYRFVHAVRDPLEVVLSGYQYHLKTTERWARRADRRYNNTSYREHLNSLPLHLGLRAEVKHAMRDALKTMPRLVNRTLSNPCTLTLRLEDFSTDWDMSMARLWDLLGVRDAQMVKALNRKVARHNVYSKGKSQRFNKHVAHNSSSSRDMMRRLVRGMPMEYEQLKRVRRKIRYPEYGRELDA